MDIIDLIMQDDELIVKAIEHLRQFVTSGRYERFVKVAGYRTRFITVVLEDIYQPQNASAVLRTCDALGIQDVHVLQLNNKFEISRGVSLGSEQWLNIYRYSDKTPKTLLQKLKLQGYVNVATSSHMGRRLEEFKPVKPVALWIGNELHGLSEECLNNADVVVRIPMWGFVESYNLSVATAIILFSWVSWLRKTSLPYRLSKEERNRLIFLWLVNTISNSREILKSWLHEKRQKQMAF